MYPRICLFCLGIVLLSTPLLAQKKYSLQSPDHSITIELTAGDSITYTVSQDGRSLVSPSAIALVTDAEKGKRKKIKATTQSHDAIFTPVVFQKTATVPDRYNQLQLDLGNGLQLEFRAYDNGIAWRWITSYKDTYKILKEEAQWNFDKKGRSWYPREDGFFSHNERAYLPLEIDSIGTALASLPALFEVNGTKLLLTEAALFNYAGMWLRGTGAGSGMLEAVFPHYPKEKKITSDRDEQVVSREDFIAQVDGPQAFPWRIMMIARTDADILTNQLPLLLGRPARGDFSWVKPGKVQWDWWHYNNVYDVDFRAGINNDTYKYYIDFASKYGIAYVLLDEGWCDTRDLMAQSKGINVQELAVYAKSKKVDLLLWTSWLVLDQQMDQALDRFAKWGIKGVKVDFMQRDDQDMVNYYEKVAKAAAQRKMLVDFHGAYKPIGWLRSYPNVLTSEGVLGNEISKFAPTITPDHTATLPFTRMAAGPMDFTPGGMLNAQKNDWSAHPAEPMTLGTRCNQMAMYVIFESPLQMLCDIPTHYYKEPEAMAFLKAVPTVWSQTIPLAAKVGDYVAMARQAANGDWFVGAMTDWTPRELPLDLSFLGDGTYTLYTWEDGPNADRNAKDFKMEKQTVTKDTRLAMKLAPGGGFVARIVKQR